MKREFTATCYVIEDDKVLLIYHKKLKKWLPPGGHMEENETPPEAAKREVLEETGLEIELLSQDHLTFNCFNGKSIERPFLCLLEEIPAYGDMPAHQHIDFIFLGYPLKGQQLRTTDEIEKIGWFSQEDVEKLESDVDIFGETKESIMYILSNNLVKI